VVEVKENTSAEQRKVALTVSSGDLSKNITVTQAGKHSLSLSKTLIDTTYEAFKDSFQVITANDWKITNVPDWITLSDKEGTGVTKVEIEATENTSFNTRSAMLKISTSYAS